MTISLTRESLWIALIAILLIGMSILLMRDQEGKAASYHDGHADAIQCMAAAKGEGDLRRNDALACMALAGEKRGFGSCSEIKIVTKPAPAPETPAKEPLAEGES